MDTILKSVTGQLLQFGVLGIFALMFAGVIYVLWKSGNTERKGFQDQIAALHESRVGDHAKIQVMLIELSKQSTAAVAAATASVDSIRETLLDTKGALKDLGDELRRRD